MSTTKPLEGIKVIEISTIITASLSAMMLSDQGAEVIKIEQTGFGDPLRYLGTQKEEFQLFLQIQIEGKDRLS